MKTTMLTYHNFFLTLTSKVPEVIPIYEEHIKDFGELLPHVMMSTLTRYVIEIHRRSQINEPDANHNRQILVKILSLLESAMASSDAKLRDLVLASFLENLDFSDEHYKNLTALFGPHLKKNLKLYERLYKT